MFIVVVFTGQSLRIEFTKKYENVEPLMVTYDKEKHDDINVMPLWVFL